MKVPYVYLNQPGRKEKKSPSFTICGIERKDTLIEFSVNMLYINTKFFLWVFFVTNKPEISAIWRRPPYFEKFCFYSLMILKICRF